MKLYYTNTSPFVRKVLVVAHEKGLAQGIQTEFLRPSPTSADPVLSRTNPLAKIPVLILDDGTSLYDSTVICEYLDGLSSSATMIPAVGAERWRALRTQALCDGILDACILIFYERAQRPEALWWPAWLEGQTQKANQALDALEIEAPTFGNRVDIATVCAAVTVGWLEFRKPLGPIRENRPALFQWYDEFRKRPSMTLTEPPAG